MSRTRQTGQRLGDRLARGEEAAFAEIEAALGAARGEATRAARIADLSRSQLMRHLRRYKRLRDARRAAAGQQTPLEELAREVPPGVYSMSLLVGSGDAADSLRAHLVRIIAESDDAQTLQS